MYRLFIVALFFCTACTSTDAQKEAKVEVTLEQVSEQDIPLESSESFKFSLAIDSLDSLVFVKVKHTYVEEKYPVFSKKNERPVVKTKLADMHQGKFHPYLISYYSEVCWSPIELIIFDKDTNIVFHQNVDCTKCGCESQSEMHYEFSNDSTLTISSDEYVVGADHDFHESAISTTYIIKSDGTSEIIDQKREHFKEEG